MIKVYGVGVTTPKPTQGLDPNIDKLTQFEGECICNNVTHFSQQQLPSLQTTTVNRSILLLFYGGVVNAIAAVLIVA